MVCLVPEKPNGWKLAVLRLFLRGSTLIAQLIHTTVSTFRKVSTETDRAQLLALVNSQ